MSVYLDRRSASFLLSFDPLVPFDHTQPVLYVFVIPVEADEIQKESNKDMLVLDEEVMGVIARLASDGG